MALVLLGGNLSSVRSQETDAAERITPRRVEGVVVTRDSLSVDVKEEDFSAVFRDIASRAQIDVSNLDGLPVRRISTRFAELSIMDGVKRLLRVANVAGYVIMTAHSEDDVKIERILFLDANANARAAPRAASPPRAARRRARRLGARSERARPAAANRREKSNGSKAVLEDLRASPETERLLNQAVDADEQGREQAIEGLMRLAGGSDRKRELMEALGPHLDDLRHGDEETREEARDVILSMMRR